MSRNRRLKINCLLADSQGGELHIEGKDQTLLYEARDTRSEKTQVESRRKGTGLGRALNNLVTKK